MELNGPKETETAADRTWEMTEPPIPEASTVSNAVRSDSSCWEALVSTMQKKE